jgi:hypothetical protein
MRILDWIFRFAVIWAMFYLIHLWNVKDDEWRFMLYFGAAAISLGLIGEGLKDAKKHIG